MTTTLGKGFPTGAFTLAEINTPESIARGAGFLVTVSFTGDPTNAFWRFIRDLGSVEYRAELVADAIGPGPDVSLADITDSLDAGFDDYLFTIHVPADGVLDSGLYELGVVITFMNAGAVIGGISAFVGDALMQVR